MKFKHIIPDMLCQTNHVKDVHRITAIVDMKHINVIGHCVSNI